MYATRRDRFRAPISDGFLDMQVAEEGMAGLVWPQEHIQR